MTLLIMMWVAEDCSVRGVIGTVMFRCNVWKNVRNYNRRCWMKSTSSYSAKTFLHIKPVNNSETWSLKLEVETTIYLLAMSAWIMHARNYGLNKGDATLKWYFPVEGRIVLCEMTQKWKEQPRTAAANARVAGNLENSELMVWCLSFPHVQSVSTRIMIHVH